MFPIVTITNYHQLSNLKDTNLLSYNSRDQKSENRDVSRASLCLEAVGENLSLFFPQLPEAACIACLMSPSHVFKANSGASSEFYLRLRLRLRLHLISLSLFLSIPLPPSFSHLNCLHCHISFSDSPLLLYTFFDFDLPVTIIIFMDPPEQSRIIFPYEDH